jgi:hypothetical protein
MLPCRSIMIDAIDFTLGGGIFLTKIVVTLTMINVGPFGNNLCQCPCLWQATPLLDTDGAAHRPIKGEALRKLPVTRHTIDVEGPSSPPDAADYQLVIGYIRTDLYCKIFICMYIYILYDQEHCLN